MIDIKLIRENPDLIKQAAANKNMKVDIDHILEVDKRRRALETEFNDLRYQQNQAGEQIAKAPKDKKAELSKAMGQIKARLKEIDAQREQVDAELRELMLLVPQVPDPAAPVGSDASFNVEVRRVGTPKTKADFGFPCKDHLELGTALGIIDMDRGVKIAGSRNYVLRGAGAQLHEAVMRLAWDLMMGREYELPSLPGRGQGEGSRRVPRPSPPPSKPSKSPSKTPVFATACGSAPTTTSATATRSASRCSPRPPSSASRTSSGSRPPASPATPR